MLPGLLLGEHLKAPDSVPKAAATLPRDEAVSSRNTSRKGRENRELNWTDSKPIEGDPQLDYVRWQAGHHLTRDFYPTNPDLRRAFEGVAEEFVSGGGFSWLPSLREERKGRLLAATVRAIGGENSKHGARTLARFVVSAVREVERQNGSRKQKRSAVNWVADRTRRLAFIRHRLRLLRKLLSTERQTVRRFDRVFRFAAENQKLRNDLLRLLEGDGSAARRPEQVRRNLEALFRHCAAMGRPSIEASLRDFRALHHEEIQRTEDANEKVQMRVISFRKNRALSQPQKPLTPDKKHRTHDPGKESLDVIDRRVRSEIRSRLGK